MISPELRMVFERRVAYGRTSQQMASISWRPSYTESKDMKAQGAIPGKCWISFMGLGSIFGKVIDEFR